MIKEYIRQYALCKNLKNYEPIVVCGGEELANTFNENLLAIVLLIIKNSSININGEVLKYITCSVSEKFFTTNTGTNNNNIIYKIPIIIVSVFPPKNLQTSKISCP